MIRIGGNPTEGTPTSINIHKNEGRVGINMDPSGFMFDVNGSFNCSTLSIGGQLFTGGGGIDDDLTVNNTLSVTGTTDLNGNVGIGTSASSSHTLDVNGTMSVGEITMNGHMIPSSNAAYDFGNAEYKIRHLFLSDNSLWLGDDTKLSRNSTDGGLKVRKRRKNIIPKKLQGHVDEAALTSWDNSISSVEDMTLAHWNRYIRENPSIQSSTSIHNTGDLYDDDDEDFEDFESDNSSGSTIWVKNDTTGTIAYSDGNVGINVTPTERLEISGTIKQNENSGGKGVKLFTTNVGGNNHRWTVKPYWGGPNRYENLLECDMYYERVKAAKKMYAPQFQTYSDDRLKHNEEPITNALNVIELLNPIVYYKSTDMYDANFILDVSHSNLNPFDKAIKEAGFIAQDVGNIDALKFTVIGGDHYKFNEDTSLNEFIEEEYTLNYNSIFTYNVKATQELFAKVKQLENNIKELEKKLEQQESQSNSSNSIVEFIYSPQLSNKTKNEIDIVTQIIDSIIKTSNQSQPYTIFIGEADLSGNQVGFANWHTKQIGINTQHDYDRYYWTLNDIPYSFNTLVILHETLHILGILGVGDKWHGKDYLTNYQYTGPNGVAGYKKVLQENGYDVTDISCIPMEDDYSEGTKNVHFDEGIELVDGVYKEESKVINGVLHPIVTNEIMSGILNSHNYLTPITLGTLEDIGYEVDISSQFVSITGNNIRFIGSNETTESLIVDVSNNIIPENTKAYVKCNCNLVGHDRNHQLFFIS